MIENLRRHLESELVSMSLQKTQVKNEKAAMELWLNYEKLTSGLAQQLCEQLRLVLEPTLASKMRLVFLLLFTFYLWFECFYVKTICRGGERKEWEFDVDLMLLLLQNFETLSWNMCYTSSRGDYRTGKRLNMRKVIPYIASQFHKDKIWLRRTKKSKRQYQIVMAVDDSSSMADNHSKQVTFLVKLAIFISMPNTHSKQVTFLVKFAIFINMADNHSKHVTFLVKLAMFLHFGIYSTSRIIIL